MSSPGNLIKKRSSNRVFKAVEFAAKAHTGQYRKATKIPYIIHPLGVAEILLKNNMPDDVVIAGLLHDTIEDTPVTIKQIEKQFGKVVANLVKGASEPDKADTWENRKKHTIEYLKKAPMKIVYLSCADKLHNAKSILDDHNVHGDDVFKRFNRPKAQQKWYYTSLAETFIKRRPGHPLFQEFKTIVKKIFG